MSVKTSKKSGEDGDLNQSITLCGSCFQATTFGICLKCQVSEVECSECQLKFVSFNSFRDHVPDHFQPQFLADILRCKIKVKRRKKYCYLFTCAICSSLFDNSSAVLLHVKKTHSNGVGGKYQCYHCSRNYYKKYDLGMHVLFHVSEATYECNICYKKFYSSTKLAQHKQLSHSDRTGKYECSLCNKSFSTKFVLVRHQKEHCAEKLFKCDQCEKSFGYNFVLKRHQWLRHVKTEKWQKFVFKCDTCHSTFTMKSDLQRHIQTVHLKQKPFECTFCGKTFSRKSYLSQHQMSHGGGKMYLCFCGKAFRYLSGYSRHKKEHNEIPEISNKSRTSCRPRARLIVHQYNRNH